MMSVRLCSRYICVGVGTPSVDDQLRAFFRDEDICPIFHENHQERRVAVPLSPANVAALEKQLRPDIDAWEAHCATRGYRFGDFNYSG